MNDLQIGCSLLAAGAASLLFACYTLVLSKFIASSWWYADYHYCYLASSVVITLSGLISLNWIGLKCFRHN